ncbi:MAG TPA: TIGR00268 family protein, partial [Bacillota bacterium]|nr:TIGR00268 family protein [Bacillota bacterium]
MDKLQKLANLKAYLKSLESLVVAYSGGVDSTFLLKVAHEVLGDKVLA